MNKKYKILKDGKIIESDIPGVYGGWKIGKIFGTLDCWSGKKMFKKNRVFFYTMEDAVSHGYRPCKNCRPMEYIEFEKIKHMVPHHETLEDFYNHKKQSPKN